jgi:hypothetical protein
LFLVVYHHFLHPHYIRANPNLNKPCDTILISCFPDRALIIQDY